MARATSPLSDTKIKNTKPTDKQFALYDGNGLQLRIMPNGTKSWLFNYIHPITKKRKNLGLGKYPDITLSSARNKVREMRQLVAENIDPKTHRDNELANKLLERETTLFSVAAEWFELKRDTVSEDYANDIWRSLELHIFPNLGQLAIYDLKAPTVINQLRPLESAGSLETVRRVCQRLNEIMTYAVNSGKIEANTFAGIKQVFKQPKVQHQKTISPSELPVVMKAMSEVNIKVITRCAFEFQLHTLTRPNEAAKAKWNEIDFENEIWTIPADKMKMKRDHKIPLSQSVIRLLDFMKSISAHREYIFPSNTKPTSHLNTQSVNSALKRAGLSGKLVSHGMRSIGSTALNEQCFNPDAIEVALAHVDNNSIRAIYNNAEYLTERRHIMSWWSDFIDTAAGQNFTISKKSI
ncbi:integrase domain-containing protein [Vibrio crassostreae]|uniref:integrase domain-containing protein n=1 Tax=Vibrio crassostreae TaxID=246167 RepID=UPI0040682AAC